ncbi:hypothetical protein AYK26_03395 [Euryarchaeota archaeon SM23-78]|nr:MAG: hypothetical protein AYK26_03395 [Euryarchaeota archaeon SM23-78]MBW3000797.1 cytidine deaminase [Candidatus Woesearchaeota archaeon]
MTNEELIEKAKSVIKPKKIKHGCIVGDVGCALVTEKGNIYVGVCIDVAAAGGFGAEQSAIASMVTHGEYRIKKLVAVWKDGTILVPCGKCREFIHQIDEKNYQNTEIIIGKNKVVKLKDLLPHPWEESFKS